MHLISRDGSDMNALLAERQGKVYRDDGSDLRGSLCYYFSIILVLGAFIMSSVSLGLCSTVLIFTTPF